MNMLESPPFSLQAGGCPLPCAGAPGPEAPPAPAESPAPRSRRETKMMTRCVTVRAVCASVCLGLEFSMGFNGFLGSGHDEMFLNEQ